IFDSWTKVTSLFAQKNISLPSWLTTSRQSFITYQQQIQEQRLQQQNENQNISGNYQQQIQEQRLQQQNKNQNISVDISVGSGGTGYGMGQISGNTENLLGTFIDFNHPRLNLGIGSLEVYTGNTNLKSGKLVCDGKEIGNAITISNIPVLNFHNVETDGVSKDATCKLTLISATGETTTYSFKFGDLYTKGTVFTGFTKKSASLEGSSHFGNLNIVTSNITQNNQMILEFRLQPLGEQTLNLYSKIEIKDANGNLIKTITYIDAKGWYPISLSLPQGVYTINLYSGSNLIESRNIGLKDGKLVSQTKVLAATGWGSVFHPEIYGGGEAGNYNMTIEAKGGTRYAIIDANGKVIQSALMPITGNMIINTSRYLDHNKTYYVVLYTKDENGKEIIASIQEMKIDKKGFPTFKDLNYTFGFVDCQDGNLTLPLEFRNTSTQLLDSLGNSIKFDPNLGWISLNNLKIGETYTIKTIIDGQKISFSFTYSGKDNEMNPIIKYGSPNIVEKGGQIGPCAYACIGPLACEEKAEGYCQDPSYVCCKKIKQTNTKCPGNLFGYGCYSANECNGGSAVSYYCDNEKVCCEPLNVVPPPPGSTKCDDSSTCGQCEKCVDHHCVDVGCIPPKVCDNNHGCKDQGTPPPPSYKYQCHNKNTGDWSCDPVVNAKTGYSDISSCEEACKPKQPTTKNCSYKSCDGPNNCAPHLTTVDINATCPKNSCDVNSDCGNQSVPGCPQGGCGDYMKCVNNQCVDNCYGIVCPAGTGCQPTKTGYECKSGFIPQI
ncbi:MAG: hypothetical protein ACPL7B_11345, partial [Candidatus Poribacteria bacterium]